MGKGNHEPIGISKTESPKAKSSPRKEKKMTEPKWCE